MLARCDSAFVSRRPGVFAPRFALQEREHFGVPSIIFAKLMLPDEDVAPPPFALLEARMGMRPSRVDVVVRMQSGEGEESPSNSSG